MKPLLSSLLSFLITLLAALFAMKAQAGVFELRYTDSSNLQWSQSMKYFTNGCLDSSGQFKKKSCGVETNPDGSPIMIEGLKQVKSNESRAALACKEIGARLPTMQEYFRMVQDFDHNMGWTGWPILTNDGRKHLNDVFGDMVNSSGFGHCYWTSSLIKKEDETAYVYDADEWGIGVFLRRDRTCSVRCVRN